MTSFCPVVALGSGIINKNASGASSSSVSAVWPVAALNWACSVNNLLNVDTVCRQTPGDVPLSQLRKPNPVWILVKRFFLFFSRWTWKRRLRASSFKTGIKFPNLSQTKGCTLQSGRISGESHKEATRAGGTFCPRLAAAVSVSAGCCSFSGPGQHLCAKQNYFSQPLVCYPLAMFYLCN